jgi:7,8-dihydropterin-6-yl-methyl-4-(beta-D-ribofuranosyl)aminobenzene 5'-phosphate synthase
MNSKIKLSIIFDNNPFLKQLQTDWGFACLLEYGDTKILFDTGGDGKILLNNMRELNIDPKSIDVVFLSHYHHDHTGGLVEFLKVNSKVKVYFPQSFPLELTEAIKNSGAVPYPISAFSKLLPDIYTLGEIEGVIPEQSLAIRSDKGIVIITGCAHPGIINILEKAKSHFPDEKIYLTLGGFHLHKLTEAEISSTINKIYDFGIIKIAPTHCSGDIVRKMFIEKYKTNYIEVGVGKSIEI